MTKQEFDEMAALVVRLRKDVELHTDALRQSNAHCGKLLVQNEQLTAELDRMKGDPLPIKLVGKLKDVETSNKTLHSELVEVRAALASVTEQRDSLKRTLDEWSNAETKPHERVAAEDVAEHVAPPVLPFSSQAHENKNVCGIFGCDPNQHGPCPLKFTKLTDDEAISRTLNSVLPICMRKPATETTPVLPMCTTCHGCGFPLRQYGRVFECPNQLCNRINTGALGSLSISPYYGPCKSSTPVRHE